MKKRNRGDEPKILRKTKKEVVSILLNLSKSSFSEGVVFGFKFGLDIAASGNPIIVKNSQTEERRKLARNSGIKSGLKRNEHKEQFYQAFIKNRMWHSTHKDILADADIKKLIKDAGISDVTADKKWIPYAMKRRLEEKAERKVTRTS